MFPLDVCLKVGLAAVGAPALPGRNGLRFNLAARVFIQSLTFQKILLFDFFSGPAVKTNPVYIFPKTPGEEDGRLCFCFVSKRLRVPNFSPSYDISFKWVFLSTDSSNSLQILNDYLIWSNWEKTLMNFLEKVSNIGYVLMSLMDLNFSTGYVINFKV